MPRGHDAARDCLNFQHQDQDGCRDDAVQPEVIRCHDHDERCQARVEHC
jgi:hypothetical protein